MKEFEEHIPENNENWYIEDLDSRDEIIRQHAEALRDRKIAPQRKIIPGKYDDSDSTLAPEEISPKNDMPTHDAWGD